MLVRWTDYDSTFSWLSEFQRRMNKLLSDYDGIRFPEEADWSNTTWPATNLYDQGKELVIRAEVPGLSEKEIQITGNQEMLTITGERKVDLPEGYSVHRQERGRINFSRSFTFPCKVDLERTSATVKNGILTITLAKAPEAQPRQITIKAQ